MKCEHDSRKDKSPRYNLRALNMTHSLRAFNHHFAAAAAAAVLSLSEKFLRPFSPSHPKSIFHLHS